MEKEIKQTRGPGRDGWISPEQGPNHEDWKGAPTRESTGDAPGSENAHIIGERRIDENAPLGDGGARVAAGAPTPFTLIAPSFDDGTPMPDVHSVAGGDLSPPLRWLGVPRFTRSVALLVEDPDSPDPRAPRRTFTHWLVVNIPPSVVSLQAGASRGHLLAPARQGRNDHGTVGYTGPAPAVGRHRYFFRLFALDCELPETVWSGFDRAAFLAAIRDHVLAETHTVGTYEKPRNPTS